MKKLKSTANGKRSHALLRLIEDIVCNPVLASYTPTGPGCLVTGQRGAAGRSGPYIGLDARERRTQPGNAHTKMPSPEYT